MIKKKKRNKKNENYHSELAQMLGIYIRENRLSQKKSQFDIVKKLGFSVQFYGRIENGTVMAPRPALSRIVSELSLDFSRILKIYRVAAISEAESLFKQTKGSKSSKIS